MNTSQRIEDVAKHFMTDDDEAVVLISDVVQRSVGPEFSVQPIGQHILRGRHAATNVFRLEAS